MTAGTPGSPRPRPGPAGDSAQTSARLRTGEQVQTVLDQVLDANSLYQLRASVAAHAIRAGLSERRAKDLVIAAHELAANVIRHGSGHGRLRIWRYNQMLHCQVSDDGTAEQPDGGGRDQEGVADHPSPAAWRVKPGHGLWLVRQLADQTDVRPGRSGSAVIIGFALGSRTSP